MSSFKVWRRDVQWRKEAHRNGRSTNLDGIPLWPIHLVWAVQDTVKRTTH